MRTPVFTLAGASLAALAYVICLPIIAVWVVFWVIVGSASQPPDRLANRYYRLAVWPLFLAVRLLPARRPAEANLQSTHVDYTLGNSTAVGV